jgi:hypothetical protein
MNNLPPRNEVAKHLTDVEAFGRARELYKSMVSQTGPAQSQEILAELETLIFRPACELQIGGLNVLSGITFDKTVGMLVSFACFAIDHLLWGWNASKVGETRIAFTLSRAAVEASIFELAAWTDFHEFEKMWRSPRGTGGALLKIIQHQHPATHAFLCQVWEGVVQFGHASVIPTLSAYGTFQDDSGPARGITIAGQYAGPLPESTLRHLGTLYALASVAAVEAMNLCLLPKMAQSDMWKEGYAKLQGNLETLVPLPKHLEKYVQG